MKYGKNPVQNYRFYQELVDLPFVEKIILFGSRARQDNSERSDIDIALWSPQATDNDWLKVFLIIGNADTLLKIDCLRLDSLDTTSLLRKNIETEGVVLYAKDRISTR